MKYVLLAIIIVCAEMAVAQKKDSVTNLEGTINKILFKDSLTNEIKINDPDWSKIKTELSKKYEGSLVLPSLLKAKQKYYAAKIDDDWNKYADSWLEYVEKYVDVPAEKNRMFLVVGINNQLYSIVFKRVTDKKILLRAASVASQVMNNPNVFKKGISKKDMENQKATYIDTYANLLYKAGRVGEAIEWEAIAVKLAGGLDASQEYSDNLKKMKEAKNTW